MAKFNEILVGRFNRALQKLLGMKGAAVTPQLSTEIMPVIPLFFGAENRYLDSWQRFGVTFIVAAAAANNSLFQLRNPVGNNVIAVVEKFTQWALTTNSQCNLEGPAPLTTDLAVSLTSSAVRFDARGQSNTSLIVTSQNTAPVASFANTGAFTVIAATNTSYDFILDENQEIPLLPGDALRFRNPNLNAPIAGFMWWRERFLEESERF